MQSRWGHPMRSVDLDAADFELALKAFSLLSVPEQERALKAFAWLRYPSVRSRFIDAVHQVIVATDELNN